MSKKQQAIKNMDLTAKLADYINLHPEASNKVFVSGASVVPFSATNKELNKLNEELARDLLQEGKQVVRAQESKAKKEPWKFILLSA